MEAVVLAAPMVVPAVEVHPHLVAVPVVLGVTTSQVAVEAVPATPQFFAALHIWSKPAVAAEAGAALNRIVVALVVEAAVELAKTVQLVEAAAVAAVVEVPVGQLEVRLELELIRAESERPMRAEMAEIAQVPMRIRAPVAEALAKPVAVAEVLRRMRLLQAAVVVVPH